MHAAIILTTLVCLHATSGTGVGDTGIVSWQSGWRASTTTPHRQLRRIPIDMGIDRSFKPEDRSNMLVNLEEYGTGVEEGRKRNKMYKKYRKYMLPLLLAYKLKFFTLIPVLIGGLVLLTGATGLAGFFFALFAATMGLKSGGEH